MQARFLLGPSGVGKTFACLAEVRAALRESPMGPPLLFLAPKQATFQLERQLLTDPELHGYTRLQILSFERLAEFILNELSASPAPILSAEGRLMVLRALLAQKRDELRLFHATARLRGFAQQLSGVLGELQRAQVSADRLTRLAEEAGPANQLDAKLRDLATMLRAYLEWLREQRLHDHDHLMDRAAELLAEWGRSEGRRKEEAGGRRQESLRIGGLWLDGFAELSAQEVELLAALLPLCDRATLAFNLDDRAIGQTSWLATWSSIGQTYRKLRRRLEGGREIEVVEQWLRREPERQRFADNPELRHLEQHWPDLRPFAPTEKPALAVDEPVGAPRSIRVVACAHPEAEATVAAREIRRFVRRGGRYRDIAVLVRNLEAYHDPIRRVFAVYEIPIFLDRREPVGHHPLAELTRSALRTVAFEWRTEDWFGALKTGLVSRDDPAIDRLENEALARGWKGRDWLNPFQIPDNPDLANWLEPLRRKLVEPFQRLGHALGFKPSGRVLAQAVRTFWDDLRVSDTLELWSEASGTAVHVTFRDQMQDWLENLDHAFAQEELPLREWLPIIETGLANQTVGVIPPALDQVLVGSVDRSRNPDLRFALLLGLNESVFPAPPATPPLLSESDRERLAELKVELAPGVRERLSQERYLGYVACTRARERLVLTFALRGADERTLNPSPFLAHLERLFPSLTVETDTRLSSPTEAVHPGELTASILQTCMDSNTGRRELAPTLARPAFAGLSERLGSMRLGSVKERLSPALAERLYGRSLRTSVSRLEEFAACPFRFLVSSGLRAEERKRFELDVREQGSFQHAVLAEYHEEVTKDGGRWRDLKPGDARARIGTIAARLAGQFRSGLLAADDRSLFTARSMTRALQDFVETLTAWFGQYEFNPAAVELGFGQDADPLPAWRLPLGEGHEILFRGKIDRVDLWRKDGDPQGLCVVIDYKSSEKRLDPVLVAHGVQLQLPAYLNVLRGLPEAAQWFGLERLIPAGVFYVNLRGSYQNGATRREVLRTAADTRKLAYQHTGRYDAAVVRKLDRREMLKGDQFNYAFKQDGKLSARSREALDTEVFQEMIESVQGHLERMGRLIYTGIVDVDPYRKGNDAACDRCQYQAICRIDPWTHEYRVLKKL